MPVNVIRLNQQEIARSDSMTSHSIQNQPNVVSPGSTSIFSLGPNILNDKLTHTQPNLDSTNPPQLKMSDSLAINKRSKESSCIQPAAKIIPITFSPRKFVPSRQTNEQSEGSNNEKDQVPMGDKIKPKWAPCAASNEEEPKYKKIQPIFTKPKSPHKIT